jgi:hypothetical protein
VSARDDDEPDDYFGGPGRPADGGGEVALPSEPLSSSSTAARRGDGRAKPAFDEPGLARNESRLDESSQVGPRFREVDDAPAARRAEAHDSPLREKQRGEDTSRSVGAPREKRLPQYGEDLEPEDNFGAGILP